MASNQLEAERAIRKTRVCSLVAAKKCKSDVAKSLFIHRSTVYSDLEAIKEKQVFRKKYDSSNRLAIDDQDEQKIMVHLAFNKFTTLEKIVSSCNLACHKSTLSKFLALRVDILNLSKSDDLIWEIILPQSNSESENLNIKINKSDLFN